MNRSTALILAAVIQVASLGAARAEYSAQITGRIEQLIQLHAGSQERRVAVFDFDNTLIFNDIGDAMFLELLTGGHLTRDRALLDQLLPAALADTRLAADSDEARLAWAIEMLKHYEDKCRTDGKAVCLSWQYLLWAGHSPEELNRLAREVFSKELAHELCLDYQDKAHRFPLHRGIRVYEEQKQIIARLQAGGFEVYIVSASGREFVKAGAVLLGVDPSHVIAMDAETKDGKLLPKSIPPATYRQGKADAIRKYVGVQPLIAFGDAFTDVEMLEFAKEAAVLIDRGDPELRKLAAEKGWLVQRAFIDAAGLPACAR